MYFQVLLIMEQDSRPPVVTPQSLQFMMSHPPPSFQTVPKYVLKIIKKFLILN